ncbi:MAG: hypothetical protein AAF567_18975 [Actinomycetota bacterium]
MRIRPTGDGGADAVFRSATEADDRSELIVDLSAVTFVVPGLVVAVGALVDEAVRHRAEVKFVPPASSAPARYLERMDFGEFLDQCAVEHDLPEVVHHAWASKERLCELTRFDNEQSARRIPELIFNKTEDNDAIRADLSENIYGAVWELLSNVFSHADIGHGFMAAQTYPGRLEICVSDRGRGILASFRDRGGAYQPDTHADAILYAVQERTTSLNTERGIGLSNLIRDIGRAAGAVQIISGNAAVNFRDGMPKRTLDVSFDGRGTTVSIKIPIGGAVP